MKLELDVTSLEMVFAQVPKFLIEAQYLLAQLKQRV